MVEGTWGGLWDASLCGLQLLGALAVRLTAVGGLLALSVRLVQESGRRQSVRARGINRRWCWLLSLFLICCYWMGTVAATPARPTHDVAPVVDDRPCKGATDSAPVVPFNGALCYWNAGSFRALERQAQVLNYLDKHKPLVMLVAEARVEATFRTPPCPDYIGLTRPHNSAAAGGMVLYHAAALSLTVWSSTRTNLPRVAPNSWLCSVRSRCARKILSLSLCTEILTLPPVYGKTCSGSSSGQREV